MSRFDAIFAGVGAPQFMLELGESVTYQEPHEDDKTITAVVGAVLEGETPEFSGGKSREDVREITILADPDDATYGGVADPPLTAAFIVTGESTAVWSVKSIIRKTASMVSLECVRRVPVEVTRPTYRQTR